MECVDLRRHMYMGTHVHVHVAPWHRFLALLLLFLLLPAMPLTARKPCLATDCWLGLLLPRAACLLQALEGFVSQVLPMRVALQLQDQQRRSSFMMPAGLAQQQQQQLLPLLGANAATGAAAGPSSMAAATGAPAGNLGAGLRAQAGASNDTAPAGGRVAGSSLRQLREVHRQRQQQQADAPQEPAQATLPARPPLQAQQPSSSLSPRQQRVAAWGFGWAPVFQQPHLEQAYQRWALQQWLRLLDTVFLLLVLLSVAGPQLQKAVSTLAGLQQWKHLQLQDAQLHTWLAALLAPAVCWVTFNLQCQPADSYLHRRKSALAAVRVLRTLLLCCEFTHLSSTSAAFVAAGAGSGAQGVQGGSVLAAAGRGLSAAAAAACGLLMMLGLLGQLPARLHAAVQAVCLACVAITLLLLHALSTGAGLGRVGSWAVGFVLRERGVAAVWFDGVCLVVLGWVLPVAVVAVIEGITRRHFLYKLT